MKVEIDNKSGFCFGVVYAIQVAETELSNSDKLYCLGDIVHNNVEVERLEKKGLVTIDNNDLKTLSNCKVLIRAHGEPPETYKIALENNIELIDASCPVVLKLQNRIKDGFDDAINNDGQIVIYGKIGHAEVNGLVGQTQGKAIVIEGEDDLYKIDYSIPITLFSQTTKSVDGFYKIQNEIKKRIKAEDIKKKLQFNDTICRQVSSRGITVKEFAKQHDVIIFVSGKKSSNGKFLYEICKTENPKSYFITKINEIEKKLFWEDASIGVCGATSTPMWLMEEIAEKIKKYKF